MDEKSEITIYAGAAAGELTRSDGPVTARNAPAIVKAAGKAAEFAWEEFFQAEIANAYTRKNYMHAVRGFLAWAEGRGLELPRVTPADVGEYRHFDAAFFAACSCIATRRLKATLRAMSSEPVRLRARSKSNFSLNAASSGRRAITSRSHRRAPFSSFVPTMASTSSSTSRWTKNSARARISPSAPTGPVASRNLRPGRSIRKGISAAYDGDVPRWLSSQDKLQGNASRPGEGR